MTTRSGSPAPEHGAAEGGRVFLGLRPGDFTSTLSRLQTVVGLVGGLVSIAGALFAVTNFVKPTPVSNAGQIVAIVREAKTEKTITDAKIEILTLQNALITTVTPNYFGKARHSLEEGPYRIRVSHPRYAAETRQIQVVKGQTAEVYLRLRGGSSSPLEHAERAVQEGVGAVKLLFGQ